MNLISKNDQLMRDFFNHTIGFDSVFNRLTLAKETSFPPYNIIRKDKQTFVELALAGYSKEDIRVVIEDGVLSIEGSSSKSP